MLKVAFQGEKGAYSEAAAISYFGNENIESMPYPTFGEALKSTENAGTDYTILPIENSTEGSVGESHDLLLSTSLYAAGEVYFRVKHCLLGFDPLDKIKTVYSHPQALGQCRKFIENNSLQPIPTYDTAGSVKIMMETKQSGVACIASKRASEIYGVPIVKEGVEDSQTNYTRFLIFSQKRNDVVSNDDKTSIIFSIKHEPGALYRILGEFEKKKINLTKIESRPIKDTPWEYHFYVDFEGHHLEPQTMQVLEDLKKHTISCKVLGSYKKAQMH